MCPSITSQRVGQLEDSEFALLAPSITHMDGRASWKNEKLTRTPKPRTVLRNTSVEGKIISEASNVDASEAAVRRYQWNSGEIHPQTTRAKPHIQSPRSTPYLAHLWDITWTLSQNGKHQKVGSWDIYKELTASQEHPGGMYISFPL